VYSGPYGGKLFRKRTKMRTKINERIIQKGVFLIKSKRVKATKLYKALFA